MKKDKKKKTRSRYAFRATFPMCSAMIDIETNYEGEESYRYDGRVVSRLADRKWIMDPDTLTPMGLDALALAKHYVSGRIHKMKAA